MATTGPSPRVRRNPKAEGERLGRIRSIPACAGEPSGPCSLRTCPWVYPRVCGGTVGRGGRGVSASGLSPRMRGNQAYPLPPCVNLGSIPAYAREPACRTGSRRPSGVYPRVCGEPRRSTRRCSSASVYPRVCGGTRLGNPTVFVEPGLSPRVRGNRLVTRMPDTRAGSIPACAGEPTPCPS